MRARRELSGLILLFGFSVTIQGGTQSTQQDVGSSAHEKSVVQGIVTAIPHKGPLKGAEVYLTGVGSYRSLYHAETDATGQFSLSEIEPGTYEIHVRKYGYTSPGRQCDSEAVQDGDDLTLISGQRLSRLNFQMLAPAVITGTVFDPSGDPVADADVGAVEYYSFNGERKISNAAMARTDDRGQFRIFHLVPGRYFVRVDHAFHFSQRLRDGEGDKKKEAEGFLPIYYPDTTEVNKATILDLKPGEELGGIDFRIHSTPVLRVRGRVINGLTGEPITNSRGSMTVVPLPPTIRENSGVAYGIDEASDFEVDDLAPGRYLVSVEAWMLPNRVGWGGWQEIDLTDESLNDLQVRVLPGHDLMGRIEAPDGKKLDSPKMGVLLGPHGDSGYGRTFANVKPDGSFLLLDLRPDTYDIEINDLPEGYYLKSAKMGSIAVTDDGLKIMPEPAGSTLVLETSPAGAHVDGIVQLANGKPACTAAVVLVPDANRRSIDRYYKAADVDRFGHFAINGVAPGGYKLFAFDNESSVGYRDPSSLEPYENDGEPIHLSEGESRTVLLKLISTR